MCEIITIDALQDALLKSYENGNINNIDYQIRATVNAAGLARNYRRALDALRVIANDEKISAFLKENDPKAYEQVVDAITKYI